MPKNEVAKTQKNEVVQVERGGLTLQTKLLTELENANKQFGADFTPYGKTCAINVIAGLVMFCKNNDINIGDIDPSMLRLQVQNVGFTELNYSTVPAELYFDLRKTKITYTDEETGEVKYKNTYSLTIKPQGAGNEKLLRKYGVGIKKDTGVHNAILIREGDEFIMPEFNGAEMTKPIYRPKLENANNKVIAVMYPIEKEDGSFEYLIAVREGVKANLIAQIRQNAMYDEDFMEDYTYKDNKGNQKVGKRLSRALRDEFYKHVDELASKMTVDEMLENDELKKYINPTYTSGGSKEAMILRKMKNNACKNYPKEYDNSYVAESVRNMFEDQDKTVVERKVDKVQREINEELNDDKVMDFTVPQEGLQQSTIPQEGLNNVAPQPKEEDKKDPYADFNEF